MEAVQPRFGNDACVQKNCESQNIAADGVGYFDGDGRGRQVADVTGVAEMFDQFRTHVLMFIV